MHIVHRTVASRWSLAACWRRLHIDAPLRDNHCITKTSKGFRLFSSFLNVPAFFESVTNFSNSPSRWERKITKRYSLVHILRFHLWNKVSQINHTFALKRKYLPVGDGPNNKDDRPILRNQGPYVNHFFRLMWRSNFRASHRKMIGDRVLYHS